jgi:hypothetical protein
MDLIKMIARKISLALLLMGNVCISFSQNKSPSPEYQIKAVFLYNFTQFIEWPASAFQDQHAPFVIGVLGEDPFGKYLDETVSGEKVNNHPLVVKRFDSVEEVKGCHIIFIAQPATEDMEDVINKLKGKNILTVSDVNGFIKKGGMIRFLNESNKIKIRINLEVAKASDLVISSKLLRLAEIVTP